MAEAMTPALYKRGAESQGNQLIIDLPKARATVEERGGANG
jgi:hypothetical protein